MAFIFILIAFAQARSQTQPDTRIDQIDTIMQSYLVHEGKRPVHNFLLYAHNLNNGFVAHRAAGISGRNDTPVDPNYQFKTASITKTFVSVLILQLMEEHRLMLDDRAGEYLADIDYVRFDEFQMFGGQSRSSDITIEMLLHHRSGVADIFTDAEVRFVLSVLFHKKRQYDVPRVFKRYYKYNLHKKATALPGERYHYSDMNYMLLGLIVEQITGQSLPQAIRTRILEPLGMHDTYFEYYEPECGYGKQIDAYLNKLNVTKKVNTSYEWAGGGLVSTTADLGTFIEALFGGRLFQSEKTLEMMIDTSRNEEDDKEAGMGIFRYHVNGQPYYGHGGYFGSLLIFSPETQVTFCANIGQANADLDPHELVERIVALVAQ